MPNCRASNIDNEGSRKGTVLGGSEHTFLIYYENQEVAKVVLGSKGTVKELTEAVRKKLESMKHPAREFVCLESLDNREVLDYSLLMESYRMENFAQLQKLRVVLSERVSDPKWMSLNDFKFKKCLGQGGSATVYLVRHLCTGQLFALKQIDKSYFVEFKRMEQVLREKKIMAELVQNFPFAIRLFASFESIQHLNFLLEFYPGGQLFFHLQNKRFSESQAQLYFAEMVLTFEYLHHNQIIYRDLKPENIMIDFQGHAKLTDFGLCKINVSQDDFTNSYCGSIEYMAPEVKESEGYNYSVDFYTLGAFLYQMVNGVPPYYNRDHLEFQPNSSPSYIALVKGLVEESIQTRVTNFKTIKAHKWLDGIDWAKVSNKQYPMPLAISPQESYIHQQFRCVLEPMGNHSDKFDKLFDFFNFISSEDSSNTGFRKAYQCGRLQKTELIKFNPMMKKKEKKNKTQGSRKNRSNSQKQKMPVDRNGNSLEIKKNGSEKNIYLKRTREDTKASSGGKTGGIAFQKLKTGKAAGKTGKS